MKIEKVIKKLSRKKNFEVGSGADDCQINNLESRLNVIFPKDYRSFLRQYGYVFWFGSGVLGICDDPEDNEFFSVEYWTSADRKRTLPDSFYPRPENTAIISPYGGGGHYFMYCENSETPGKVILLLDELMGREGESWNSFTDFIAHYS